VWYVHSCWLSPRVLVFEDPLHFFGGGGGHKT